ncbi:MAG TPA: universal stress protein [Candidatus Limnocylindrales bacterium]|jgi:nucleotide-binding universal stress UspA family protein|nr:universal stress protein [Candidatus Limnocylindrales bacterium]
MPDTHHPAPFRRAILGLNGGPSDPLVVRLAVELAHVWKTELVAVHVVEVDWSHDLDEDLARGNDQASAVLDIAEGLCEKERAQLQTELLQARDVGAAIVDEAAELDADVIILGLPYRKKFGGDFAMGRTVPYVLQNAPCGVIVVREPIPTGVGGAREPATVAGVGSERTGRP